MSYVIKFANFVSFQMKNEQHMRKAEPSNDAKLLRHPYPKRQEAQNGRKYLTK